MYLRLCQSRGKSIRHYWNNWILLAWLGFKGINASLIAKKTTISEKTTTTDWLLDWDLEAKMKLLFLVSAAFAKLGIKQTKFFSEKEFTVKLIPLNRIRSNRSIISKKATRTTVDFGPVGQSFMVARVAVNTFTVQMPLSDFVQFRTTMRHGQRVIKSVLYPMA